MTSTCFLRVRGILRYAHVVNSSLLATQYQNVNGSQFVVHLWPSQSISKRAELEYYGRAVITTIEIKICR